jgi:succinate-semialdehyde dehydrogenase/glutarate-semialdehyde dehydrogenase
MGAVELIGGLSDLLKDKTLLKHAALIGGQWVKAKSGAEFSVINPATGKEIAKVPNLSAEDVKEAIHASEKSFLELFMSLQNS